MAIFSDFAHIQPDVDWPVTAYTLRDIVEGYGYDWNMQDYPIFDETYRDILNQKIYDHFKLREVASATPQQFIFFLNRKMNEIMPAINAVYEKLDSADPFSIVHTMENETTQTGTSNAKQIFSDTPQVQLVGSHDDYASSLTGNVQDSEGTSKGKSTSKAQGDYINRVIAIWLSGANNGDIIVFSQLEPLFLQIWTDEAR